MMCAVRRMCTCSLLACIVTADAAVGSVELDNCSEGVLDLHAGVYHFKEGTSLGSCTIIGEDEGVVLTGGVSAAKLTLKGFVQFNMQGSNIQLFIITDASVLVMNFLDAAGFSDVRFYRSKLTMINSTFFSSYDCYVFKSMIVQMENSRFDCGHGRISIEDSLVNLTNSTMAVGQSNMGGLTVNHSTINADCSGAPAFSTLQQNAGLHLTGGSKLNFVATPYPPPYTAQFCYCAHNFTNMDVNGEVSIENSSMHKCGYGPWPPYTGSLV